MNLVQHDGEWLRVGGSLLPKGKGTFTISSNGEEYIGSIYVLDEKKAYQIKPGADGGVEVQERPLGEALCLPVPRPRFEAGGAPALPEMAPARRPF